MYITTSTDLRHTTGYIGMVLYFTRFSQQILQLVWTIYITRVQQTFSAPFPKFSSLEPLIRFYVHYLHHS